MKRGMKAFFGALLLVLGLVATSAGGFVAVLVGPDGEIAAPAGNVTGEGYALVFNEFTIDTAGDPNTVRSIADFQVAARSADNQMIFMGIGPSVEVNRYLNSSARDIVSDLSDGTARVVPIPGREEPSDPTEESFWDAQAQGLNPVLSLEESGVNQSLVIMNLDASEAVSVSVTLGLVSAALFPAALGVMILGVLLLVLGIWVLVRSGRKGRASPPVDGGDLVPPTNAGEPTQTLPTVGAAQSAAASQPASPASAEPTPQAPDPTTSVTPENGAQTQTDVTDARFGNPANANPGPPNSSQTNG